MEYPPGNDRMSPPKACLKMMFLFARWDMLVPRKVYDPIQGGVVTPIRRVITYSPSYPFIRPFIGVVTPYISGRGQPCTTFFPWTKTEQEHMTYLSQQAAPWLADHILPCTKKLPVISRWRLETSGHENDEIMVSKPMKFWPDSLLKANLTTLHQAKQDLKKVPLCRPCSLCCLTKSPCFFWI